MGSNSKVKVTIEVDGRSRELIANGFIVIGLTTDLKDKKTNVAFGKIGTFDFFAYRAIFRMMYNFPELMMEQGNISQNLAVTAALHDVAKEMETELHKHKIEIVSEGKCIGIEESSDKEEEEEGLNFKPFSLYH